ncbi:class I SAM-dependent methyltransferase [Phenylobacterium immobile]|uniref:class I SAM-dependent methyltransferase n=1 Tax=Phenylobacterium immobile TaxID=21 RepID=UPI000A9EA479|nr:50S ribosomal protein L11 methyltransferase [Phenylobacterium immobile]
MIGAGRAEREAFILANTRLQRPPHTPELELHLADEVTPIWRMTEEALKEIGLAPPFWAFAWAGGQALARYVLDHPEIVSDRAVIDFASGSGLVGIAAARAGAARVLCADIDSFCEATIGLNAAANGVAVEFTVEDLLNAPAPAWAATILAGDICYEKPVAERVLAWLAAARAAGAEVLIGDPLRSYFPRCGLEPLAEYQVETTTELEDMAVKRAGVWRFP